MALLCSPSKALQDTVQVLFSPESKGSLPVLDFISRRYDLDALRNSMKIALRKAACRVYAMEVGWVFLFQYCELDNEESHTILKNLDESPKVTRYPESERVTSKLVRILMNSQESQKNQLLKCHSLENFSIRCCFISSSSNWQSCNSIFNRLYL